MTFKDFVENLSEYLKNRPETADLTVATASDSEGNSYYPVWYDEPTLGIMDNYNDFTSNNDGEIGKPNNAICVN